VPRLARSKTPLELGLTEQNCRDVIDSLTVENYSNGPDDDRDRPGTGKIWTFGSEVSGVEVYIKLKVFEVRRGIMVETCAKCLSFHRAERSIRYPFATQKQV
jgi:hypothetical protein